MRVCVRVLSVIAAEKATLVRADHPDCHRRPATKRRAKRSLKKNQLAFMSTASSSGRGGNGERERPSTLCNCHSRWAQQTRNNTLHFHALRRKKTSDFVLLAVSLHSAAAAAALVCWEQTPPAAAAAGSQPDDTSEKGAPLQPRCAKRRLKGIAEAAEVIILSGE